MGVYCMQDERRKEQREPVEDDVLYLHYSKKINNIAQHGLAFDLSDSGACIYAQQEYSEGDTIKIFCKDFGDAPAKANVCWCKKIDDRLYKVGLRFNSGNGS